MYSYIHSDAQVFSSCGPQEHHENLSCSLVFGMLAGETQGHHENQLQISRSWPPGVIRVGGGNRKSLPAEGTHHGADPSLAHYLAAGP